MKKPYKNGILLAATSNSAFAIGTMVANIAEVMSGEVDIFYIVHDGFTQGELEAFARVLLVERRLNLLVLPRMILLRD
ncbi:hypothetical protein [Campylobacter lanienae]|uniref:hypothetical protein n=1 Tax=Campylobacter lanienae TaxID=75658 RepID=UPI000BB40419|nr:hypothetical protein [Campylobacter lanienae]